MKHSIDPIRDVVSEQWGDVNDRPQERGACSTCGGKLDAGPGIYQCHNCRHTECHCPPGPPEPTLGYVVHDGVRMPYSAKSEYIARLYVKAYPEAALEPVEELVGVK